MEDSYREEEALSGGDGSPAKWYEDIGMNSVLKLGFGVCDKDCLHGDINYFYDVIHDENNQLAINPYKVPADGWQSKADFQLIGTARPYHGPNAVPAIEGPDAVDDSPVYENGRSEPEKDGSTDVAVVISRYTAEDVEQDGILVRLGKYSGPHGQPVYITRSLYDEGGYEDERKTDHLVDIGLSVLALPDTEDEYGGRKLRVIDKGRAWVIEDGETVTFLKPDDY